MSGGSKQPDTTTTVNKTELPPEARAYQAFQNAAFQDFYNKGLGVYGAQAGLGAPAQTVAPLSTDELAGIAAIRAGQGSFEPYFTRASNYAANATTPFGKSFAPSTVSTASFPENADRYMSPYVRGALDTTAAELDRRFGQQRAGMQANAAASNAFGGDREALLEAEAARNHERDIGDLYATGMQTAYTNAANQFQADEARRVGTAFNNEQLGLSAFNANRDQSNTEANRTLDASKVMSGLAALRPELVYGDANALLQAGGLNRQISQATYDANYNNAVNAQNFPWMQLQRLQGTITPQNIPIPVTSTGTSTAPGTSRAAGAFGGALAGAGAGGMIGTAFGGPGIGSAIGGLAGLALGAFM